MAGVEDLLVGVESGAGPGDAEVVPAGALVVIKLEVERATALEGELGGGLRRVFGPLAVARPAGDMGDALESGGLGVGREPEFGGVVAGDEETINAVGGRDEPAAHVVAVAINVWRAGRQLEGGEREGAAGGGGAVGDDGLEGRQGGVGGEVVPA